MSKELRDLFKKDLDRIPLRPAETWVPAGAQPRLRGPRWRAPLAIAATVALVVLAIVGGRELAAFRDRMSATATGGVAGKAIYLHCPNGYGRTKLSNTAIEKALGIIPRKVISNK